MQNYMAIPLGCLHWQEEEVEEEASFPERCKFYYFIWKICNDSYNFKTNLNITCHLVVQTPALLRHHFLYVVGTYRMHRKG